MGQIWLLGDSDFAKAFREPNLLVPGGRPVGDVKVDLSNPLAQKLEHLYIFKDGLGVNHGVGPNAVDVEANVYSERGFAEQDNARSTTTQLINVETLTNLTDKFTVSIKVFRDDLTDTGFFSGQATTAYNAIFWVKGTSYLAWRVYREAGTSSTIEALIGSTYDNQWVTFTATYDGSYLYLYINGEEAATPVAHDGAVRFINSNAQLLGYNFSSRTAKGLTEYLYYDSKNALTAEEVRSLYLDPYQVFKPANDAPYLVGVASGGITLTPNSATHAHAADQPTLTQANTLTPADALQAHTAESPTLTQLNILAPADAQQAQTADQPSLVQAHVLAVASASQLHVADSTTLTVAGDLNPDNALHGHLADQPTLTQAHAIAPDDADQVHSADQPTLDISITVTPDDADHTHAAGQPTLTQAHLLSVIDAVHAHTADEATLAQHLTLVADDALHAHLADNANLIFGTLETPSGRVFLVRADRRVFLIN